MRTNVADEDSHYVLKCMFQNKRRKVTAKYNTCLCVIVKREGEPPGRAVAGRVRPQAVRRR